MKDYFIDIPKNFTSFEFYNTVLTKLEYIHDANVNIIFDFSVTERIEPLVIPNLLCLGRLINSRFDRIAQIYIPDTFRAGFIKNYLYEIGFTKYAKKYGYYEFINEPTGGMEGKEIDPVCGTIYVPADYRRDDVFIISQKLIGPFSERYLSQFDYSFCAYESEDKINLIRYFLYETILNCLEHAESVSFTTLQGRFSNHMVYISVSDIGPGFVNTINKKCNTELEAILEGVYKREPQRDYGLYGVIIKVLENEGKLRIHSNDTQVIFSNRLIDLFKYKKLLEDESFMKYNVKKGKYFRGVHIEIELPLVMRGQKND